MKKLFWLRHAQPEYPGGKRICLGGKIDVPLSEQGILQAQQLGDFFKPYDYEAVFCSPMHRAYQTAQRIARNNCPLIEVEELRELDGGLWDGMCFDEIRRQYPLHFVQDGVRRCPPGGETDEQGLLRARRALKWIDSQVEDCAVIVAHSGLNRILLSDLMGIPLENKKQIPQEYGCIHLLEKTDETWKAVRYKQFSEDLTWE